MIDDPIGQLSGITLTQTKATGLKQSIWFPFGLIALDCPMIRVILPALFLALTVTPSLPDPSWQSGSASAQEADHALDWDDELTDLTQFSGFDVLPLGRAHDLVQSRFYGRLIAARLTGPSSREHERGAELVYEMRLLTPRRDVLIIRLDARSGEFLEVAGAGLTQARRQYQNGQRSRK